MNAKQKKLLQELGEALGGLGFSKKAVGQTFIRKTRAGLQALHVAFIKHPLDFDVVIDFAIRIDALEEFLDQLMPGRAGGGSKAYSFGVELGNLIGEGQKRWSIGSEFDVAEVVNNILKETEGVGLPYLERYLDLAQAFELLSQEGREGWIHSPLHAQRAARVVALAWLLGYREKIPLLATKYRDFMNEIDDFGISYFDDIYNKITKL
jgi:hypothetical protein